MGLFDSLAKNALGSMLGGSSKQDPAAMLSGLLGDAGGLQGLMSKFQDAGLGAQFSSWISTDENQPIESQQLEAAVGTAEIQKLAETVGMGAQTVLPLLTQFLPRVIDKLTPNGNIEENHPSGAQIQSVLMSAISSGLGGFFGGKR